MSPRVASAEQAKREARQATRKAAPWLYRLGRLGYTAQGVVYVLVGVLAILVALGLGGETTDPKGVLDRMKQAPFGPLLLGMIGISLLGYAVWRFVQAVVDPESQSTSPARLLTRAGCFASGVIYGGLGLHAVQLALGLDDGTRSSDQITQELMAGLLQVPIGPWLVGIAGTWLIGSGLHQFYRAVTADFRAKLELHRMSGAEVTWATGIGRLGFAARGIVYSVVGGWLLVAAFQMRPEQARAIGGALASLAAQPFGPWLLGAVAAGLIAYGIHLLVEARYRRMTAI